MKRTTWLFVLASSVVVVGPAPQPLEPAAPISARRLVLAPAVSDNLALFFSQFSTELVVCLEGHQEGDVLTITRFEVPHILISEPGRVQATGCASSPNLMGTWHNHPPTGLGMAATNEARLRKNCYLSRTDISDFRRRSDAIVSVVSCGPRTFAYWWRRDVEELTKPVALLPPPRGQLVQTFDPGQPPGGGLTQAR